MAEALEKTKELQEQKYAADLEFLVKQEKEKREKLAKINQ